MGPWSSWAASYPSILGAYKIKKVMKLKRTNKWKIKASLTLNPPGGDNVPLVRWCAEREDGFGLTN
jgi:hypothetical protein